MSPIGLGNDIGGSLRNPAFCCGIASLKPTFGRIPQASSIEPRNGLLVGQMMAVEGPMARTVADLRLALSILAGPHPRDPRTVPAPLVGPAPAAPIRVAMVPHPAGGTFVTPMNLLGLPAVCVPTGVAARLPVGVQVIGDRHREDLCLDAAAAIERRLGRLTPIDPRSARDQVI